MSGTVITTYGNSKTCWVLDRCMNNVRYCTWQSIDEVWFDLMADCWISEYDEVGFSLSSIHQFLLSSQPIHC